MDGWAPSNAAQTRRARGWAALVRLVMAWRPRPDGQ
jgi:hypothetical protein